MNNIYYVYILIDPRNEQPFYVGKGKGKRYKNHEKEFEKHLEYFSSNYHLPEKMLSLKHKVFYDLKQLNLKYNFNIIEDLSEDDAFLLEHALIAWFGRKICGNGILTNLLSGGKDGELFFDDQLLIQVFQRNDLQKEILKYSKTSTKWIAKSLYFYNNNLIGYPFQELNIDWLYQYHGCYQQFAINVIDILKEYDSVITPFYWIRKIQPKKFEEDNIYIMKKNLKLIEEAKVNGCQIKDLNNYIMEYKKLVPKNNKPE